MGRVPRRIGPIPVTVLAILCACAAASTALAGRVRSYHERHGARVHHTASCLHSGRYQRSRHHTRSASFRQSHRSHHLTRCARRRGATHRVGGRAHGRGLPSTGLRHSAGHERRSSLADAGGICPDGDLAPSAWNVDRVRAAVLCLINRERAARGEAALRWNSRLEQAAQSHTESMAFGNYFEHVGPGGDTPGDRMRASGYIYSSRLGYEIAENIAWGALSLGTPRAIVVAWMASPGHRENILNPSFRDTAVGVSPHLPTSFAHGQAGGIYTQDFGAISGS
jgi:uncharacterized protein YkwD